MMKIINIILLIISISFIELIVTANSTLNVPISEYNSLQELFSSLGGEYWTWKDPNLYGNKWNFTGSYENHNPCIENWQGLLCSCSNSSFDYHPNNAYYYDDFVDDDNNKKNCFITKLYLIDYNLVGSLVSSISNFSYLTHIHFGKNKINSMLPTEIGLLTNLEVLSISNNYLTKALPAQIGNLKLLRILNLAKNKLSGYLTSSIGSCTSLTYLKLNSNNFYSSLPDSIKYLTNLTYLSLYSNGFQYSLPSGLFGLTKLTYLSVSTNKFNGPIEGIGNLVELTSLSLFQNYFSQSLPSSIGYLTKLIDFQAQHNEFTGVISTYIGNLQSLQQLNLGSNLLTGSLVTEIGNLKSLTSLALNYNNLNHGLPSEIGNLVNLVDLYLYNNQFNYSLPTELGLLTNLTFFGLYVNNFSGSLPSELGNLKKLEFLGLYYNKLSSSVPKELGNLKKLSFLGLFNNTLTGSVASELGGMNDLSSFLLYNNRLTGSIPYELGGLSNLVSFQVQNNLLSSSIPTSFSNFEQITNFDASQNSLSGPIPYEICNLKNLRFIFLYNNMLSSSIPNCFGDFVKINYIDLSNNQLTGTIPSSISTISTLKQLFLYSNVLDGNINKIFNSSIQLDLTNIDLSDNQLTGKLSAEPFFSNILKTFAIVGNCLTGSLPLQICKAKQLTVLALDGLHTAEKCQNKFFPFSDRFTSYSLTATIENGIPSCIYNMTNLKTLHLSGNGLKDNIEKIHLGNVLTDFSLSHNILTGIIPESVQNKVWKNLDLSFNKIGGTLNRNISLNSIYSSSIFLEVNRLSGSIPKTFKNVRNISVLKGNLFECTKNELPIYDNETLVYECGSQSIIVSFSIWIILALFSLLPFLLYILLECSCKSFINDPKKIIKLDILYHWLDIFKIQDDSNHEKSLSFNSKIKQTNINMLGSVMNSTRIFCFYIVLFIVVIFLPTFSLLSIYFSTYEYKYGWTISCAFLSGIQPGIIILVVFLSLAILIIYLFKINYLNEFYSKVIKKKVDDKNDKNIFKKNFSYLVLILFINGIFVILANIGFVYITITYDSFIITISSIAMSIFKIIWNGFAVSSMISKLKSKMSVNNDNDNISDIHFTSFQVLIAIFNNIIMPCIATASINPNCFYNVLIPPPVVTASYDYDTCISFSATTGECTATGTSTGYTFYNPPFSYGYQCSSVLVTSYASVYVYMFITNSFMNPLQSILIHYLHKSSTVDSVIYKIIDNITDPILKVANKIEIDNTDNSIDDGDLLVANNNLNESLVSNPTTNNKLSLLLFNKDTFVVGIASNIAILLTFGVVYPPLSIIILLGIFSTSYCAQLSIGRLYRDCQKNSIYTYLELLEKQCNGIYYSLKNSILLVIPFSFLFISFFLFDIFGDAIGSSYAFIIMILQCLIPFALFGILYIYNFEKQ